jgi:hypothetical protein
MRNCGRGQLRKEAVPVEHRERCTQHDHAGGQGKDPARDLVDLEAVLPLVFLTCPPGEGLRNEVRRCGAAAPFAQAAAPNLADLYGLKRWGVALAGRALAAPLPPRSMMTLPGA